MRPRTGMLWLLRAAVIACGIATSAQANTITVDSLADDLFPSATGTLVDISDAPVTAAPHCTFRMALAAANLNLPIPFGGSGGCAAGAGADTIVFAGSLTTTPGTITLADRPMSEAPATYVPTLIIQPALIASGPVTITGPGSGFLTIDGGLPGNSGRRLLLVSDGTSAVDAPFSISGVRLLRGRALEQSAGCMFSAETTTINDVIFESCESVGGPTQGGFGGALGAGNVNTVGNFRPNVTINNALFVANRSTRGTSTTALPQVGGAYFGSGGRWVGTVTITNSRFLGNSSESVGGMQVQDASAVSISNSQFVSNTAIGSASTGLFNGGRFGGFRVASVGGPVDLTNVAVVGNTANQDRAGFSVITVTGITTITNGSVLGNIAINGRIGGFEVLTDVFDPITGNCTNSPTKGAVVIDGLDVDGNRAAINNGGFRVQCSAAVSLANMSVKNNEVFGSQAVGSGGNSAGNIASNLAVTMTNVKIVNNKTFSGAVDGGFSVLTVQDNASLAATGLLVKDNYAQQNEGGMTLRANGNGRNYTVTNSAFVGNAANFASALLLNGTGNYTVRNSTFSRNSSSSNGPIFVNMNAAVSNAVVFENVTSARNSGGNLALEVGSFGSPTNTPNGTVTIKNTIMGSGTGGIGLASVNLQPLANVTYAVSNSLIENNSFGVPAGICGASGNVCNLDARLENVADNGGSPTLTVALKPGSPALDSGNSTGVAATDQRGVGYPRVIGSAVDMGAFESPALPALCSLDVDGNGSVNALTDGLLVLRAMFGLTGTAVTTGAVGSGATRLDWTAVRNFLNGSCGASFAN